MFSFLSLHSSLWELWGSEPLGSRGADNYSYSEKVQRCLCFFYGAVWEQRRHMRKGEWLLHEALLRDF